MDTENIQETEEQIAKKNNLFSCDLDKVLAEKDFVDDIIQVNEETEGGNILLTAPQLKEVLNNQRDAITLYLKEETSTTEEEPEKDEPILQGYSILLGLNQNGVEGFKIGEIKTICDIIPSEHLSNSVKNAESVYIVMIHGFDIKSQVEISMDVFDTIAATSDIALTQTGTSLGQITMDRLGFQYFYGSSVIKFCEIRTQRFEDGINDKLEFLDMMKRASSFPEE